MYYKIAFPYALMIGAKVQLGRTRDTAAIVTGIIVNSQGYLVSFDNGISRNYAPADTVQLLPTTTYNQLGNREVFLFADGDKSPRLRQKLSSDCYRTWGSSRVHNIHTEQANVYVWRLV